ncbi:hypothetical protein EV189_3937 [Motilibacter rhizosphaerae]|uniref:Uncharacterized protein n=1 Tax=Motilibacter rhizosphaerae TaxID=598652 RepID=A0A4Q7N7F2_9ACTN|nr:hypothetical protein EV189_3937 [Motilibacter rhizosphaerae]
MIESGRDVVVQMWVNATREESSAGWPAVAILGFDEHDKIVSHFGVQDTAEFLVAAGVLDEPELEAQLERVPRPGDHELNWEQRLS